MPAATDDQMVVHGHAERMGGLDDVSGDGDVRRVTKKPGSESNGIKIVPTYCLSMSCVPFGVIA
jgi:hypothetical protein